MISKFTASLLVLGMLNVTGWTHELPLDEVRRDAQVVIFPDRVEVQYAVVMGTATMRKESAQLQRAEQNAEQGSNKDPDASERSETDDDSASREEWDRYREQIAPKLARQLQLLVDGRLLDLELRKSETEQRHHTTLRYVFAVDVAVSDARQRLLLVDRNFADNPGVHRVAAKGRRGVALQDSSQPATVSRIERKPWETKSPAEKSATIRVSCVFFMADEADK